jgi:hypothetical protein
MMLRTLIRFLAAWTILALTEEAVAVSAHPPKFLIHLSDKYGKMGKFKSTE